MHPSLRILAVLVLAVLIQFASLPALGGIAVLLLIPALGAHRHRLGILFYRSRWLLLTMVVIYAFTTPGEYIPGWGDTLAPTYEGLTQGALQAGRLIVMLAAIALVLGTTPREMLMAGIYTLMRPIRSLGLAPERFAARLWLTLHYVEEMPRASRETFWQRFDALEGSQEAAAEKLSIPAPCYGKLDMALIGAVLAGAGFWWAA